MIERGWIKDFEIPADAPFPEQRGREHDRMP
jgi:hypothetical protein